jgi:tetratricopeptide (TPR) repeat protein
MENLWLESRRDIFLRDLVQDFIEAKLYIDVLREEHSKTGTLPYCLLDTWVGSETKKGALWNLKDQCHSLFRNRLSKSNLYEHLFDWTIGSIFHEAIKLKEDSYQMETYRPLLEQEIYKQNVDLSQIVNDYFDVIENARKNLAEELERINHLFSRALLGLIKILPLYRDNILLVRFLLDNTRKLSENVFGKKAFNHIMRSMFPEGIAYAYLHVAEECMQSGWYRDAARYLKKALKLDATNKKALELLQKAEQEII